ncbi:MAG: SOS response-associated peptidase [Thermoplasmatota archaeon]
MAGRIVYTWDPKTQALLSRLSEVPFDDLDERVLHVLDKFRYNCPPASHLPVVAHQGGRREIIVARWGFPIPQRWNGVFNTRVENLDKPMWAGMWKESRCAFVVRGFYEWQKTPDGKVPFFIHRADGEPMVLGGLVGERNVKGETKPCFSAMTCPPNQVMAPVHDRMPIILEPDAVGAWLEPATPEPDLLALARPAGEEVLTMHQVGPDVGSTKNDRPDLMEAV